MIGMIRWVEEKRRKTVTVREERLLHMRILCAEISRSTKTPRALLRKRLRTAEKQMRKLDVDRLLFPAGTEDVEYLCLPPVSTLPLRRMLAAEWTRAALLEQSVGTEARVVVSAEILTGEVVRTVTHLALHYRYVMVDVPRGGQDLCRRLQREYGVSLLTSGEESMGQAEALVLFHPRTDCPQNCPVCLQLYEETQPLPPLLLPPVLERQLPQGIQRGQLLAALVECGALRPGQITVGTE